MERLKIIFKGRVQGVGFRFQSFRIANDLNLTGSVENLSDGSVLAYVQGQKDNIDVFIEAMKNQKFIRIDSIDTSKLDLIADEKSFKMLY